MPALCTSSPLPSSSAGPTHMFTCNWRPSSFLEAHFKLSGGSPTTVTKRAGDGSGPAVVGPDTLRCDGGSDRYDPIGYANTIAERRMLVDKRSGLQKTYELRQYSFRITDSEAESHFGLVRADSSSPSSSNAAEQGSPPPYGFTNADGGNVCPMAEFPSQSAAQGVLDTFMPHHWILTAMAQHYQHQQQQQHQQGGRSPTNSPTVHATATPTPTPIHSAAASASPPIQRLLDAWASIAPISATVQSDERAYLEQQVADRERAREARRRAAEEVIEQRLEAEKQRKLEDLEREAALLQKKRGHRHSSIAFLHQQQLQLLQQEAQRQLDEERAKAALALSAAVAAKKKLPPVVVRTFVVTLNVVLQYVPHTLSSMEATRAAVAGGLKGLAAQSQSSLDASAHAAASLHWTPRELRQALTMCTSVVCAAEEIVRGAGGAHSAISTPPFPPPPPRGPIVVGMSKDTVGCHVAQDGSLLAADFVMLADAFVQPAATDASDDDDGAAATRCDGRLTRWDGGRRNTVHLFKGGGLEALTRDEALLLANRSHRNNNNNTNTNGSGSHHSNSNSNNGPTKRKDGGASSALGMSVSMASPMNASLVAGGGSSALLGASTSTSLGHTFGGDSTGNNKASHLGEDFVATLLMRKAAAAAMGGGRQRNGSASAPLPPPPLHVKVGALNDLAVVRAVKVRYARFPQLWGAVLGTSPAATAEMDPHQQQEEGRGGRGIAGSSSGSALGPRVVFGADGRRISHSSLLDPRTYSEGFIAGGGGGGTSSSRQQSIAALIEGGGGGGATGGDEAPFTAYPPTPPSMAEEEEAAPPARSTAIPKDGDADSTGSNAQIPSTRVSMFLLGVLMMDLLSTATAAADDWRTLLLASVGVATAATVSASASGASSRRGQKQQQQQQLGDGTRFLTPLLTSRGHVGCGQGSSVSSSPSLPFPYPNFLSQWFEGELKAAKGAYGGSRPPQPLPPSVIAGGQRFRPASSSVGVPPAAASTAVVSTPPPQPSAVLLMSPRQVQLLESIRKRAAANGHLPEAVGADVRDQCDVPEAQQEEPAAVAEESLTRTTHEVAAPEQLGREGDVPPQQEEEEGRGGGQALPHLGVVVSAADRGGHNTPAARQSKTAVTTPSRSTDGGEGEGEGGDAFGRATIASDAFAPTEAPTSPPISPQLPIVADSPSRPRPSGGGRGHDHQHHHGARSVMSDDEDGGDTVGSSAMSPSAVARGGLSAVHEGVHGDGGESADTSVVENLLGLGGFASRDTDEHHDLAPPTPMGASSNAHHQYHQLGPLSFTGTDEHGLETPHMSAAAFSRSRQAASSPHAGGHHHHHHSSSPHRVVTASSVARGGSHPNTNANVMLLSSSRSNTLHSSGSDPSHLTQQHQQQQQGDVPVPTFIVSPRHSRHPRSTASNPMGAPMPYGGGDGSIANMNIDGSSSLFVGGHYNPTGDCNVNDLASNASNFTSATSYVPSHRVVTASASRPNTHYHSSQFPRPPVTFPPSSGHYSHYQPNASMDASTSMSVASSSYASSFTVNTPLLPGGGGRGAGGHFTANNTNAAVNSSGVHWAIEAAERSGSLMVNDGSFTTGAIPLPVTMPRPASGSLMVMGGQRSIDGSLGVLSAVETPTVTPFTSPLMGAARSVGGGGGGSDGAMGANQLPLTSSNSAASASVSAAPTVGTATTVVVGSPVTAHPQALSASARGSATTTGSGERATTPSILRELVAGQKVESTGEKGAGGTVDGVPAAAAASSSSSPVATVSSGSSNLPNNNASKAITSPVSTNNKRTSLVTFATATVVPPSSSDQYPPSPLAPPQEGARANGGSGGSTSSGSSLPPSRSNTGNAAPIPAAASPTLTISVGGDDPPSPSSSPTIHMHPRGQQQQQNGVPVGAPPSSPPSAFSPMRSPSRGLTIAGSTSATTKREPFMVGAVDAYLAENARHRMLQQQQREHQQQQQLQLEGSRTVGQGDSFIMGGPFVGRDAFTPSSLGSRPSTATAGDGAAVGSGAGSNPYSPTRPCSARMGGGAEAVAVPSLGAPTEAMLNYQRRCGWGGVGEPIPAVLPPPPSPPPAAAAGTEVAPRAPRPPTAALATSSSPFRLSHPPATAGISSAPRPHTASSPSPQSSSRLAMLHSIIQKSTASSSSAAGGSAPIVLSDATARLPTSSPTYALIKAANSAAGGGGRGPSTSLLLEALQSATEANSVPPRREEVLLLLETIMGLLLGGAEEAARVASEEGEAFASAAGGGVAVSVLPPAATALNSNNGAEGSDQQHALGTALADPSVEGAVGAPAAIQQQQQQPSSLCDRPVDLLLALKARNCFTARAALVERYGARIVLLLGGGLGGGGSSQQALASTCIPCAPAVSLAGSAFALLTADGTALPSSSPSNKKDDGLVLTPRLNAASGGMMVGAGGRPSSSSLRGPSAAATHLLGGGGSSSSSSSMMAMGGASPFVSPRTSRVLLSASASGGARGTPNGVNSPLARPSQQQPPSNVNGGSAPSPSSALASALSLGGGGGRDWTQYSKATLPFEAKRATALGALFDAGGATPNRPTTATAAQYGGNAVRPSPPLFPMQQQQQQQARTPSTARTNTAAAMANNGPMSAPRPATGKGTSSVRFPSLVR